MAHTITVTPLMGGTYRSIYCFGFESDGVSGELTNYPLISPAMLGLPTTARLSIESIEYNFADFDGRLYFDSTLVDKALAWTLHSQLSNHDFIPYGGIKDQTDIDGNGSIVISTSGFGAAGVTGSLIVKVRNG